MNEAYAMSLQSFFTKILLLAWILELGKQQLIHRTFCEVLGELVLKESIVYPDLGHLKFFSNCHCCFQGPQKRRAFNDDSSVPLAA